MRGRDIAAEPGNMKETDLSRRPRRQNRFLKEHVHDPYKLGHKLAEPTRCPRCGAVYEHGRWAWSNPPSGEVHETLCQACHRIEDGYPAGELVVDGAFALEHRDEIEGLARNIEQSENAEHPLHRIMGIAERDGGLVVTTTDVHLPRRIGHALENAWQGELEIHYDEEGYFARAHWQRDT